MNWKRFGWTCLLLGLIGEYLSLQAWWLIGANMSDWLGWFIPPQAIADLLDHAGTLVWLGIAVLIAYKMESKC